MPITLHSLFEITEQLPKNTMFYIQFVDQQTYIPMWHDQLAQYEKDNLFNIYVFATVRIPHGSISSRLVYQCVKMPYNYGHEQQ